MGKTLKELFEDDLEGKTIPPDFTISQAIDKMKKTNARSFLVQDEGGRGVGVLSEGDIVRAFDKYGDLAKDQHVKHFMAIDLVVAEDSADLDYVIKLMAMHDIRHMPVISRTGHIIYFLDIMQVLMEKVTTN